MWVFNRNALILAVVGLCVFAVVFVGGEAVFGESDSLAAVATSVTGVIVVAADLLYLRRRADREMGFSRYFRFDSGGTYGFLPAWIISLVILGGGVSLFLDAM